MRIKSISLAIIAALTLSGCGSEPSSISQSDELDITNLIPGTEECHTYNWGDSIYLQADFINTSGASLSAESNPQIWEQGYTASFYQDMWEIQGTVVISDATIGPGEPGKMYVGFTRSEIQAGFSMVDRVEVLKDGKVLLDSNINVDLRSLCVDSKF